MTERKTVTRELERRLADALAGELLELAWGLIANAGGGDWDRESPEWRGAAERWRDRYHAALAATQPEPGK